MHLSFVILLAMAYQNLSQSRSIRGMESSSEWVGGEGYLNISTYLYGEKLHCYGLTVKTGALAIFMPTNTNHAPLFLHVLCNNQSVATTV